MSEGEDHKTVNNAQKQFNFYLQKFKSKSYELVSTNLHYLQITILNNYYLNFPFHMIKQCNCKNTIPIGHKSIKYSDRKIFVITLTLITALFNCSRFRSSFKFRWLIAYYACFSILFCRENLNPFL
jgi:hypothetical protein